MRIFPLFTRWGLPAGLAMAAFLAVLTGQAAEPLSDAELLAGAAARIEEHRKADVVIRVLDAAGKAAGSSFFVSSPGQSSKRTEDPPQHAGFLHGHTLRRCTKH
jgi:hypothetical protein